MKRSDMTPLVDLTHELGADPVRTRRPVYVDLLPPCNNACPAKLTGRQYRRFEYAGPADAERVVVLMGSGAETACETAAALRARGESVGVLQVRLYRPFAADAFVAAFPESVRAVSVLEQTKEGAAGEPLYLDVVTALAQAIASGKRRAMPRVIGGRYGLSRRRGNRRCAAFATHVAYYLSILSGLRFFALVRPYCHPYGSASPKPTMTAKR